MTGIHNLNTLLKSMKPELQKGEFVFCTCSEKQASQLRSQPLLTFKEKEGITLILKKEDADKENLSYENTWALISLTVHSDLAAVGLLAVITTALANKGISCNVVSGYYHDHLFVPFDKAKEALLTLQVFSKSRNESI